jgi:hypothetical protein
MALIHNDSGNINLQLTVDDIEQRLHRLEKQVFFFGKSSGVDGDAGDWTLAERDESGFPVGTVPTQAEADAAAESDDFNETVEYEDGSSAYGPKPLSRVNEHGSPAKEG